MSRWHAAQGCCSHPCGPCDRGPYNHAGWYEPGDWLADAEWPMARRHRRPRRPDPETAALDLEARLEELRRMVAQVEADLGELRGTAEAHGGT